MATADAQEKMDHSTNSAAFEEFVMTFPSSALSKSSDLQDMTDLERTIHTMEFFSNICADPKHRHSFQTVNFMITGSVRRCAACDVRLPSMVFPNSDSSKQIVRCLACGDYAHRSCASSHCTHWKQPCTVNVSRISAAKQIWDQKQREFTTMQSPSTKCRINASEHAGSPSLMSSDSHSEDGWCDDLQCEKKEEPLVPGDVADTTTSCSSDIMEWTTEGPPRHWAMNNPNPFVSTITIPTATERKRVASTSQDNGDENVDKDGEEDDEVHITPLHHADHPFASVSRALQDNIIAHFNWPYNNRKESPKNQSKEEEDTATEDETVESNAALFVKVPSKSSEPNNSKGEEVGKKPNTLVQLASATRTMANMPGRLGMATVAGGIAGGVAGLAMAGPAGAYAGYQLGKCAGVLGVVLEGSVSIGVVVASVATASFTAKRIQHHMDEQARRVLTMGEEGISRKVLLVRPSIHVDPVWNDICAEAKRNAPKSSGGPFFFLALDDESKARERYQRDSDIIQPTEKEIPTADKVLLLTSRILNDKNSVPGHVYRSLIKTFREQCSETVGQDPNDEFPSRRRRDNAHAVIKHVTATLLEVRPGFGKNTALTELTATAVEGFFFGEVYELVFEEIEREVSTIDKELTNKIKDFGNTQPHVQHILNEHISDDALWSLRQLPSSHTAVEKLTCCTTFLEKISHHFSIKTKNAVCADSLLKMVCQHVLVAKLHGINAEIAFLEEFARDEQLLRGREGYALVTLQAALHFLNLCSDIKNDIFEQDDQEMNVPVHEKQVCKNTLHEAN